VLNGAKEDKLRKKKWRSE